MTTLLTFLLKNWQYTVMAFFALIWCAEHYKFKKVELNYQMCEGEIKSLQMESKAQKVRTTIAANNAELAKQTSEKQVISIMQSNIPVGCDGAIKWMKDQAIKVS